MSSAAYQTSAKPRGRRESYSEVQDKPSRSRASSSASMRLSKTLSRTLDEVSVPRNSRPSSPAVYNHRQRALDLRSSDPSVNSRGQVPEPRTRGKAPFTSSTYGNERDLPDIQTIVAPLMRSPEPHRSVPASAPDSRHTEPDPKEQDSVQSPQGLTRNTRSFRSLASMQPTVTEEADDGSEETVPPIPLSSIPSPQLYAPPVSFKVSEALPRDIPVPLSPEMSTSSPQDFASNNPRASESSLDELMLAAPLPKVPIPFIEPHLISQPVKIENEEGATVPIAPSPGLRVGSAQPHDQAFLGRTPFASPPHSPMLHYMGSPPLQAIPYSHPFAYPPPLMPNPTYSPGFYPTQFTSPNIPNLQADVVPRSGSADAESERTRLLEKVSNVLPDINRLLHHYQETQGLLSEKENLVKQAESQHVEDVAKLRIELTVTKEEFEKIIGEQAAENVRLKGELSEQVEKASRLESSTADSGTLREEFETLQSKYKELETNHEQSKSTAEQLILQKQALETEVEGLKKQLEVNKEQQDRAIAALKQSYEAQKAETEQVNAKAIAEHKAGLSKIQLDLAGMITKHTTQKKDLDSARAVISEQEQALSAKDRDLEEATAKHKKELETSRVNAEEKAEQHKQEVALWSKKMAESIVRREDMVNEVRTSLEGQIEREKKAAEVQMASITQKLATQEKKAYKELEIARSELQAIQKELVKERDAHNLTKELHSKEKEAHDSLKNQHEAANKHHIELTDAMLNLKNKQAEWNRESEKMDRILQSLGQLGSSKTRGKGDEYFVSAFNQLAFSVEEISKHFFPEYLDDTGAIIKRDFRIYGLPDVMGGTETARGLRCLVIQNQIFDVLQRRIFEPFLFTLAYDEYDTCGVDANLSMIAGLIRAKSVNREAIWRSITMRAFYGSVYGRKSAATAAGAISKEIMDRIQFMATPGVSSLLFRAVRLVVKAAVQIWRRARLEWDVIYSTMPLPPNMEPSSPTDIMLWVRPHVARERISPSDQQQTGGGASIYLQGTAIRHDSPLITARRRELLGEATG